MKFAVLVALLLLAGTTGAKAACITPSIDQNVRLDGHPFAVEPTSDSCHVFVSYQTPKSGMIAVLENVGGKFRLLHTINTSRKIAGGMSLSHDGHMLAVAGNNGITLFATDSLIADGPNPQVAMLDDGDMGAIFAQFSRDDGNLFVSEEQNAAILVVDVHKLRDGQSRRAKIGRIPVGKGPVGLALSPDGARLFATSETMGGAGPCPTDLGNGTQAEGALFVIDTAKAILDPGHGVVEAMKAGCSPVRVVISLDGHALWISERGSNSILGLDAALLRPGGSRLELTTISVGKAPIGLAIREDGSQLWVANSDRFGPGDGSVTVIAPATPGSAKVHDSYGVGHFPRDLRFMPDGKTLILALFSDDTVGVHLTGDIK